MSVKRTTNKLVRVMKLSAITVEDGLQPRVAGLNQEHVTDLADAFKREEEIDPLVVYHDDAARKWWLSEGFHRYAAASLAKLKVFTCEVRKGDRNDALLNACCSNRKHGLKRTNNDKRRAVELLLAAFSQWSDRRIADEIGVSNHLVADVRGDLFQVGESPTCREGADGKSYPVVPSPKAQSLFPGDGAKQEEKPSERSALPPKPPLPVGGRARQTPPDQAGSVGAKIAVHIRGLLRTLAELEAERGITRVEEAAKANGIPVWEGEGGLRWRSIDDLSNMVTELTGAKL